MTGSRPIWIGADPGGKGRFGVAVLRDGCEPKSDCVDCADAALSFVRGEISGAPAGMGVDAPLWWSGGLSSDRHADQWLRKRHSLSGGQVQAANSLRGAALVQAVMFIQLLREVYPAVPVTEVHPKALLRAVAGNSWQTFSDKYGVLSTPATEHGRDAIIAAVAARESFEGRWTHDLASTRLPSEQNPREYWLAPVHYYWPVE